MILLWFFNARVNLISRSTKKLNFNILEELLYFSYASSNEKVNMIIVNNLPSLPPYPSILFFYIVEINFHIFYWDAPGFITLFLRPKSA